MAYNPTLAESLIMNSLNALGEKISETLEKYGVMEKEYSDKAGKYLLTIEWTLIVRSFIENKNFSHNYFLYPATIYLLRLTISSYFDDFELQNKMSIFLYRQDLNSAYDLENGLNNYIRNSLDKDLFDELTKLKCQS